MSESRGILRRLTISRFWSGPLSVSRLGNGESVGGPEVLLGLLETQLGLTRRPASRAERILQYSARLAKAKLRVCKESFANDPWGTAANLLIRRDELLLWGWDGKDAKGLPDLARDLAAAEAAEGPFRVGVAERLKDILAALDEGQKLPAHEVVLCEAAAVWPRLWREVFKRLTLNERKAVCEPQAVAKSALRVFQGRLAGDDRKTDQDASCVWWRAASMVAAADAVAGAISRLKDPSGVTVLCEDAALAALLNDRLIRRGVPSMGAQVDSAAHPVLQVLPLAVHLLWKPLDPGQLLDFLTLPECPISEGLRGDLAKAVAEQPGMGGQMWEEIRKKHGKDEKGVKRLETLDKWLTVPEGERGKAMPKDAVIARCGKVAQWAQARRAKLMKEEPSSPLLRAFERLAGQASTLSQLASATPAPLSEAHLGRLIIAAQEHGVSLVDCPSAAGGPRWIQTLAELSAPVERLVWLGVHGGARTSSPWTASERAALEACGIEADVEDRAHTARREAERAALARVSTSLLAVELAALDGEPQHPVWVQASAALADTARLLEADLPAKDPWSAPLEKHKPARELEVRELWEVDPKLLKDRETTSASELETRLGCPLKWVLSYGAGLYESKVATLPGEYQLRGNFSHRVIAAVFDPADPPKTGAEAGKRADKIFKDLLEKEAAPLALPGAARERTRLLRELTDAAKAFHDFLTKGEYELVGFEFSPAGKLDGRDFKGRLDCFLKSGKSAAVVDMKYDGSKYGDMLSEGKALQLAVYAAAAAGDGKGGVAPGTAVAYFIVKRGRLYTPEGSPLKGAEDSAIVDGPSAAQTWAELQKALKECGGWLESGLIPARPLQEEDERPGGSGLALTRKKKDEDYGICRYCSYQNLCGTGTIE